MFTQTKTWKRVRTIICCKGSLNARPTASYGPDWSSFHNLPPPAVQCCKRWPPVKANPPSLTNSSHVLIPYFNMFTQTKTWKRVRTITRCGGSLNACHTASYGPDWSSSHNLSAHVVQCCKHWPPFKADPPS
eukprot:gene27913-12027_t